MARLPWEKLQLTGTSRPPWGSAGYFSGSDKKSKAYEKPLIPTLEWSSHLTLPPLGCGP